MILGHAHPAVIKAVQKVVLGGTSFGAPTEIEILLAEMIIDRVPGCEMVRLVNSGTEATEGAIKVARKYFPQCEHRLDQRTQESVRSNGNRRVGSDCCCKDQAVRLHAVLPWPRPWWPLHPH